MGFGIACVSSDSRVPRPPARMTTFTRDSRPRRPSGVPEMLTVGAGGRLEDLTRGSPRLVTVRVAFDEQIFLLQKQGGISRYFVELMRNLPTRVPLSRSSTPFRSVVNRHALEALPDGRFAPAAGPSSPTRNSPQQQPDHVAASSWT